VIELRNVHKEFERDGQRTRAVDDVSFHLPSGQTLCLIGTSGCGKSTTLKMINRLIEPTSGEILIDEVDARSLDPIVLRRRIGYVIQQVGLFPHFTIAENIGLVARLDGWDETRIRKRVGELMEMANLPAEMGARYPHELSGGQQQRVGVIRALMLDPAGILMDEPFGALDPITRSALQDEFARLQREMKKTIVLVTHDLAEAVKLGNLVGLMDRGRLIQCGPPDALMSHPANPFVEEFFRAHLEGAPLDSLSVMRALDTSVPIVSSAGDRAEAHAVLVVDAQGGFSAVRVNGDAPRAVAPLASTASVREALQRLLDSGEPVLPVIDGDRRVLGAVSRSSVLARVN
jgi:osmoprotectant transport system ATP-binding protein